MTLTTYPHLALSLQRVQAIPQPPLCSCIGMLLLRNVLCDLTVKLAVCDLQFSFFFIEYICFLQMNMICLG